jgi:hypothetical protein
LQLILLFHMPSGNLLKTCVCASEHM